MLGHIHKRQSVKDVIVYAGSLIAQNVGEIDSNHGYVLWDINDKNDIEYK